MSNNVGEGYTFVPQISTTISSVYVPKRVEEILDFLKSDRDHGATSLTRKALEMLEGVLQETIEYYHENKNNLDGYVENGLLPLGLLDEDTLRQNLLHILDHIGRVRPSMASIYNCCVFLETHLSKSIKPDDPDKVDPCTCLLSAISLYDCWASDSLLKLSHFASEVLSNGKVNRILVYSNSTAIQSCIITACKTRGPENPLTVYVCESRPLNEGLHLIEKLLQSVDDGSLLIELITDAQSGIWIQQSDLVLIGADAVFPDGSFVNKTGSYLVCLAAYHSRKVCPVYIVTPSDKIVSQDTYKQLHDTLNENKKLEKTLKRQKSVGVTSAAELPVHPVDDKTPIGYEIEEKDSDEVLPFEIARKYGLNKFTGMDVRNVYFETTPSYLVSGYITEQGMVLPAYIGQVSPVFDLE